MNSEIEKLGFELFTKIQKKNRNIFSGAFWSEFLLDQVVKNSELRVNLFRLIDILPQLTSYRDVSFYIRYYLIGQSQKLPFIFRFILKIAMLGIISPIFAVLFQKSVKVIAGRFIISRDAEAIAQQIILFHKQGISLTLDVLGEDANTYFDADNYKIWYWWLIKNVPDIVSKLEPNPGASVSDLASLSVNISIKISSLVPHINTIHPWLAVRCIRRQLIPLLEIAKHKNVEINLDLESFSLNEITYSLFESIIVYPNIAIVVQGYLKKSLEYLEKLLELSKNKGISIGIRLVKGAYWDFEVINASQRGFIAPVFTNKVQTDYNFELLTKFLINNLKYFRPAFGTHNIRSISHLIIYAESKSIPKNAYEIQMLYGMAEQERRVLRERGHRVRVYTPIGDLLPGMAYLVRRLLENTSNSGFLKISRKNKVNKLSLLRDPLSYKGVVLIKNTNSILKAEKKIMSIYSRFLNCPFTDFSILKNRFNFRNEIKNWIPRFPVEIPVVLAGHPYAGDDVFVRTCPDNFTGIISNVHLATFEQASKAVNIAEAFFPLWREVSINKRAFLLFSLANLIEQNRFKLASLQCFEVSKTWAEADADVAEAIDFCRFYAAQALEELVPRFQTNILGETNVLQFDGRGPCVIISPWNFPLAILCGMSVAALVAGNPIIIKPAENASLVAFVFFELLIKAGFPAKACQFLPGKGSVIGSYLVKHPKITQIAFTGSNEVGLKILENAAKVTPGQRQIKGVVCEMGGKNAIIIDKDSDLEEALAGVINSAFGFAGQKCSAASRILIHSDIYWKFLYKLIMYCSPRITGSALSPASFIPPVIDSEARNRLFRVIREANSFHNLVFLGEIPARGLFVPVAIFEVANSNNKLMSEEFFGPIIALLRISSFAEGLKIAINTNFALTGSVFSRNPNHLKQAANVFRVGNLYLNRESTGALVNRQPFGGFGISGTGIKAGGPGYLLNFVDARVITENTMQRGFTSEFAQ